LPSGGGGVVKPIGKTFLSSMISTWSELMMTFVPAPRHGSATRICSKRAMSAPARREARIGRSLTNADERSNGAKRMECVKLASALEHRRKRKQASRTPYASRGPGQQGVSRVV